MPQTPLEEWVERTVATAPPITDEQLAIIAKVIREQKERTGELKKIRKAARARHMSYPPPSFLDVQGLP